MTSGQALEERPRRDDRWFHPSELHQVVIARHQLVDLGGAGKGDAVVVVRVWRDPAGLQRIGTELGDPCQQADRGRGFGRRDVWPELLAHQHVLEFREQLRRDDECVLVVECSANAPGRRRLTA